MARIRTIKPEFWTSEQVMDCEPLARLLFIGIWNFADDLGHIPNSPRRLKAQIFPGDAIDIAEVARLLSQLIQNGLLASYVAEGHDYLAVTGWKKHQRIDKPSARYPAPADKPPSDDCRPLDEASANVRRGLGEASPPEGKGEEWKGKEKESKGSETDADARALSSIEDLKAAIADAFSAANACTVPDTSRAALWVSQGFEPAIVSLSLPIS